MAAAGGDNSNCLVFQNTAKHHKTTSGQYHRYIPPVSQEFDCRVKANIKPESKYRDLKIKDEEFKTHYSQDYPLKNNPPDQTFMPPKCDSLKYIRNVEEKFFAEPARPIPQAISAMKESFQMNYFEPFSEIKSPLQSTKCYLSRQGCEQQPAVPPYRKGFWRWTDPYLSTYKAQFGTYGDEVNDNITAETMTFYNESKFDFPPKSGNRVLFDRAVFRNVLPVRLQSRAQPRVPNFGMQTEYQGNYIGQTFSKLHSILHEGCTEFEDSLPAASRWQIMAAPAMYCSEYCNIGRKSTRCTIDQSPPREKIKTISRTKNCCRIYD